MLSKGDVCSYQAKIKVSVFSRKPSKTQKKIKSLNLWYVKTYEALSIPIRYPLSSIPMSIPYRVYPYSIGDLGMQMTNGDGDVQNAEIPISL